MSSDCPNEGFNYDCNANVCECTYGFSLNGEVCEAQGIYLYQFLMKILRVNIFLFIISKSIYGTYVLKMKKKLELKKKNSKNEPHI